MYDDVSSHFEGVGPIPQIENITQGHAHTELDSLTPPVPGDDSIISQATHSQSSTVGLVTFKNIKHVSRICRSLFHYDTTSYIIAGLISDAKKGRIKDY